ncbi:SRPBCC domain-containing protein [Aureispira sp. CCB-E]|uniref:SRPBCC domain-containing protein n=1 Tax=Aureispira sp. CCB-E TaxID=3051121 RepID=UPI0028692194|nr:SRPBCC domain-containing protein [Aureispira sp. CCB-E]WMX14303.1 SRPBCC domain-containing protein [Aureispira sp. CCB-E]
MKSCHTEVIINAPVSKVWDILLDVERYPIWNPSILKTWGTLKEGRLIFAHVAPLQAIVPIQITSLKKEKELIWKGTLLSPSIIKGAHYYRLQALDKEQTLLQHGEEFTGSMSRFIPSLMLSKLKASYQYHNQKLKIIAERGNK